MEHKEQEIITINYCRLLAVISKDVEQLIIELLLSDNIDRDYVSRIIRQIIDSKHIIESFYQLESIKLNRPDLYDISITESNTAESYNLIHDMIDIITRLGELQFE
jgi:hypothetical protein